MLHGKHADLAPRRHTADRVGHVEAGALLAHDDRADVRLGGRFDDRVDRVADQAFGAFALEDLGDGGGSFHSFEATANTLLRSI
jgi:hypothetical protein